MRILVVEGNTRDSRERHRRDIGHTPSQSYAAVIQSLAQDATVDLCFPTDPGANLPDPGGLEGYDGIVLTGSHLHLYEREAAALAQVALVRAAFATPTPMFGSCWGLQVATAAAGGSVRANPKGREVGVARAITLTSAGLGHPLYTGKAPVFESFCVHRDEVETLPPDAVVLATNRISEVQAAEYRVGPGRFWGVQYHPEFDLPELVSILRRYGPILLAEGFFRDPEPLAAWLADLAALTADPGRADIAWRYGLTADVLDPALRLREIRNWIACAVRPTMADRGRA